MLVVVVVVVVAVVLVCSRSNNIVFAFSTPSRPIKSLDVRGFDSSRLLILKGGNSHARRI